MKLEFFKMHGCGNDYIYLDFINKNIEIENIGELSIRLSNRHFGIGSDGLVLILNSSVADVKMRMFNSDGSEGNMCGNAIRCIAKYVKYNKYITNNEISIETLSGIKHLRISEETKEIEVDMGKAIIETSKIPVITQKNACINEEIDIEDKKININCISMGNPHCVIFMDNIEDLNINEIGPKIENHRLFPNRTNVEFVKINGKNNISMRVWERGSGETLACGTGACASVVSCVINGIFGYNEDVLVNLKGGKLVVKYSEDETVKMTGSAEYVFSGEIEV